MSGDESRDVQLIWQATKEYLKQVQAMSESALCTDNRSMGPVFQSVIKGLKVGAVKETAKILDKLCADSPTTNNLIHEALQSGVAPKSSNVEGLLNQLFASVQAVLPSSTNNKLLRSTLIFISDQLSRSQRDSFKPKQQWLMEQRLAVLEEQSIKEQLKHKIQQDDSRAQIQRLTKLVEEQSKPTPKPAEHPWKAGCRYGVQCKKPFCNFRHPESIRNAVKREENPASTNRRRPDVRKVIQNRRRRSVSKDRRRSSSPDSQGSRRRSLSPMKLKVPQQEPAEQSDPSGEPQETPSRHTVNKWSRSRSDDENCFDDRNASEDEDDFDIGN